MPFDFDRIIDHQLYLATQQCIQPYVQRRVSSAPTPTYGTHSRAAGAAAAIDPARTAGGRKASLGSLISPWSPPSSGGSSSGRRSNAFYPARPSAQGYSPVDLFFAAPAGLPVRRTRGTPVRPALDSYDSSFDQFVTAPVGDFTAAALLPPPPGIGSRPGSSDSENWTYATASVGSGTGTATGLDTTVEHSPASPQFRPRALALAPSSSSPSPPLLVRQAGKMATYASTEGAAPPQPSETPAAATQDLNRVSAITLLVEDLARTKRFYERVFGAPCLFEDATSAALRFNGGALIVNLCESADARREGLLGPGVDVGERGDADRRFLLSVFVDDVEVVYRRLRGLGGEGGEGVVVEGLMGPVTRPWGMRVVTFRDPAGHCWEVAQDVKEG
ncbi:hypothetical protein J7T55_003274 [Diaporthe amygdali]|uniref:uncharacterized protein n=1 Tax=Phomopsis amygdali TaxID=1214568 RepID=UPI0022FE6243|nr:uncharacterized protein J7T55_003274 [Diaporthe amygdali]KAJ0122758.1 hypothetical protein J7T55_003274 [Diaporthe amygdali]